MTEIKNNGFNPNYAVPPGAILDDWLKEHGMSQSALAERMDRPIKTINEIIRGKISIRQETALQLEAVTGVEASFWTNADRIYQERYARLEDAERLKSWVDWAKQFPYAEMVKKGWISAQADPVGRVRALLRSLGVASPDAWEAVYVELQVAYRKSPSFHSHPAHLGAWLRQGELQAAKVQCEDYDESRFKNTLAEIRRVTREPIEKASEELIKKCKSSGVAIVFVPELSKTCVSGATRWLTPSKALIQLSLRYKTDDHLWFTFFHEAAHILLHGKKGIIVEFKGKDDPKEQEANKWAADFLIAQSEWRRFVATGMMTAPDIQAFAKRMGVAPGIVVGRLQHEKHIRFDACNHLKRRLQLVAVEPD